MNMNSAKFKKEAMKIYRKKCNYEKLLKTYKEMMEAALDGSDGMGFPLWLAIFVPEPGDNYKTGKFDFYPTDYFVEADTPITPSAVSLPFRVFCDELPYTKDNFEEWWQNEGKREADKRIWAWVKGE